MILKNDYIPPILLRNGHLNTIFTSQFRKKPIVNYFRKKLITPDTDFLMIDCIEQTVKNKVVIVLHGLESNTDQAYMKGAAKILSENNFSVVTVNFRSCSGEPNLQYHSYHTGKTDDLHFIIEQIEKEYKEIYLLGFSLGGNLILNYLGEQKENLIPKVKKAMTISAPCHFYDTALHLIHTPSNVIYRKRFLARLKNKLRAKIDVFPEKISIEGIEKIKTLQDYDNYYTAPAHGFNDAMDYWKKCSSVNKLSNIQIPTLLLNAQDDPFLTASCFPIKFAKNHPYFDLKMPKHGGHVGFYQKNEENILWHEKQIISFLENT